MRLWNLVTGKKAGVLQFDKGLLAQVGEGRFSSGEGRKVVWDDGEGEEYVIGFERGAVVFGMDSKPKGTILPQPLTKVHQIRYLPSSERNILLVSTEDGRILFYNANTSAPSGDVDGGTPKADALPACKLLAQLGGRQAGVGTRIKDFDVLLVSQDEDAGAQRAYIVVTACSDGAVKVWMLNAGDLESDVSSAAKQVGKLLGSYETANRITCMKAFAMSGRADSVVNGTEGGDEEDNASSSESDDSNE